MGHLAAPHFHVLRFTSGYEFNCYILAITSSSVLWWRNGHQRVQVRSLMEHCTWFRVQQKPETGLQLLTEEVDFHDVASCCLPQLWCFSTVKRARLNSQPLLYESPRWTTTPVASPEHLNSVQKSIYQPLAHSPADKCVLDLLPEMMTPRDSINSLFVKKTCGTNSLWKEFLDLSYRNEKRAVARQPESNETSHSTKIQCTFRIIRLLLQTYYCWIFAAALMFNANGAICVWILLNEMRENGRPHKPSIHRRSTAPRIHPFNNILNLRSNNISTHKFPFLKTVWGFQAFIDVLFSCMSPPRSGSSSL